MDRNTLISLKNGDTYAFEKFLSIYEKMIFNYCFRISKDKDVATDVTQDTFIKVFTNRKKINIEKNIKTWLFTIATNAMYDHFRSKKRHKEIKMEDVDESAPEFVDENETDYNKNIIISDIDKGLNNINIEYKKALILFYHQGFDYKEISEILSMPINTVKTHISRGRAELKKQLSSYVN
jgi:RNA polymerase sigma-70 factor (ECF subfamily)